MDRTNQIFVGKALVESAEFGERYNWVGFVLCPSCVKRISSKLPSANFKKWEAELKPKSPCVGIQKETVWAYLLGNDLIVNGKNSCLDALEHMGNHASNDYIKRKYQNSIDFLGHFSAVS